MSFSIGPSGPRMGPGWALELFGDQAEGRAFDLKIALRLMGFLRPYRKYMLAALMLMLATSVLALAVPYLVKIAIDENIATGNIRGLTRIAIMIAAAFIGIYMGTAVQPRSFG